MDSKRGKESSMTAEENAAILQSLRHVIREAPELTEAARLFGFVSLFSTETLDEGESVVKRALERDSNNLSLQFILGQLYAKKGSYAAARVVFRRLLDRKLDPGFNASVRRQFDFADARIRREAELAARAAEDTGGEATNEVAGSTPASSTGGGASPERTASGVTAPRLIRASSGSRGSQRNGIYSFDDPRTSFRVPQDRQVIVQFEWEGTPGPHHFEGRWKDPNGRTFITEFEYDAPGPRFGGYWSLDLSADSTIGEWELEVVVDGVPAGAHRIEISKVEAPD